jgi:hypothetical protein
MKKYVSFALLWVACSLPAMACERPSSPTSIPDGKSASKDDMMAAEKTFEGFKWGMYEYLSGASS